MFSLGMAFRCNRQFKKALVKYGLKAHKHLHFQKDEKNRVRANCSWPGCKWLIYGSKTTRSDWFKVVTFIDEHSCPPRRDNRLVTSNIIAKHYFSEIKDNPTWKVELIKKAVLKDLLADVSPSKCKRAKALVLKAALDSMKGEYSKLYDYQLELLRSNPGSTVVVYLNPEFEDQVFERFYVCFDACKKGFLAGCRKVIGRGALLACFQPWVLVLLFQARDLIMGNTACSFLLVTKFIYPYNPCYKLGQEIRIRILLCSCAGRATEQVCLYTDSRNGKQLLVIWENNFLLFAFAHHFELISSTEH